MSDNKLLRVLSYLREQSEANPFGRTRNMARNAATEIDRLRAENEALRARVACFKDCSAGVHLDMEAGCVSVCKSLEECQGWRAYLPALGKDE